MRYAHPKRDGFKVLELGCGAGANIPFFSSLGAEYYSVESSEIIVSKMHEAYPQFRNTIVVGDFTKELPNEQFDLIVDRAALIHNKSETIELCIQNCNEKLKPGGKFVGVDWFSTKCSSFEQAQIEDDWTRVEFVSGPFVPVYRVHFTDKERLSYLFSKFDLEVLEHKTIKSESNSDHPILASWNFVAAKL